MQSELGSKEGEVGPKLVVTSPPLSLAPQLPPGSWLSGPLSDARGETDAVRGSVTAPDSPRPGPGTSKWVCAPGPGRGGRSRGPSRSLPRCVASVGPSLTQRSRRRAARVSCDATRRSGALSCKADASDRLLLFPETGRLPSRGSAAAPRLDELQGTGSVYPCKVS